MKNLHGRRVSRMRRASGDPTTQHLKLLSSLESPRLPEALKLNLHTPGLLRSFLFGTTLKGF